MMAVLIGTRKQADCTNTHVITTKVFSLGLDDARLVAEVNYGGYTKGAWQPNNIWVQITADEKDPHTRRQIKRAILDARKKGFAPIKGTHFFCGCQKCETENGPKVSLSRKLKALLGLPETSDILSLSLATTIGMKSAGQSRQVAEELVLVPYQEYRLCVLHGASVRYDEEPID